MELEDLKKKYLTPKKCENEKWEMRNNNNKS